MFDGEKYLNSADAPPRPDDWPVNDIERILDDAIDAVKTFRNGSGSDRNELIRRIRLVDINEIAGLGLYKTVITSSGTKKYLVYDIESDTYRDKINYVFPFSDKMQRLIREGDYKQAFSELVYNHSQEAKICLSFLLRYILYSIFVAGEVCSNIEGADDVMATGFNWCPPIALYQALNEVTDVKSLIRERLDPDIDIDRLFERIKPSRYDFRPFFKTSI